MHRIILTSMAGLALGAAPVVLSAQETSNPQASGEVIQTQANPRGSDGPATVTPPDPATANSPMAPAMPADPSYHAGPYVGALTPPPPEAFNKTYPLCSRTIRDSCMNPSEAGASGGGRHMARRNILRHRQAMQ